MYIRTVICPYSKGKYNYQQQSGECNAQFSHEKIVYPGMKEVKILKKELPNNAFYLLFAILF